MTEDEMVGWHHQLHGLEFVYQLQGMGKDREARCAAVYGVTKSQVLLRDRTNERPEGSAVGRPSWR